MMNLRILKNLYKSRLTGIVRQINPEVTDMIIRQRYFDEIQIKYQKIHLVSFFKEKLSYVDYLISKIILNESINIYFRKIISYLTFFNKRVIIFPISSGYYDIPIKCGLLKQTKYVDMIIPFDKTMRGAHFDKLKYKGKNFDIKMPYWNLEMEEAMQIELDKISSSKTANKERTIIKTKR